MIIMDNTMIMIDDDGEGVAIDDYNDYDDHHDDADHKDIIVPRVQ